MYKDLDLNLEIQLAMHSFSLINSVSTVDRMTHESRSRLFVQ